jgi:RimJ/RimL family protein N-acetyltransferase
MDTIPEITEQLDHLPPARNADTALFTAVCKEDGQEVIRTAYPYILDAAAVVQLWFRLSQFPVLFASPQQSNFRNFVRMIQDEYSVMLRIDDVGLILITDIVPGVEARMHLSFWDSKLSGREPIVREAIKWITETLNVRRVSVPVRADARAMKSFLERVGLYFEGVLKNWIRREDDGRFYDLYLFGITNQEIDPHWLAGRSWAKPRVRLLRAYETQ